jgi:hypothetical protein
VEDSGYWGASESRRTALVESVYGRGIAARLATNHVLTGNLAPHRADVKSRSTLISHRRIRSSHSGRRGRVEAFACSYAAYPGAHWKLPEGSGAGSWSGVKNQGWMVCRENGPNECEYSRSSSAAPRGLPKHAPRRSPIDIERIQRSHHLDTSLLISTTLSIASWPYGSASRELLDRSAESSLVRR